MTASDMSRGGATLSVLTKMDPWEADCILNLRMWCDGYEGHTRVREAMTRDMGQERGVRAFDAFSQLITLVCHHAHRPLVRHDVACPCVGADECVFCHIIKTASDGHLADAALTASLLVGAAHAEHVAILAGEVGRAHRDATRVVHKSIETGPPRNVVRLH